MPRVIVLNTRFSVYRMVVGTVCVRWEEYVPTPEHARTGDLSFASFILFRFNLINI